MRTFVMLGLAACGGAPTWIVEGTVVEVRPPSEVVLDHEAIAGLMGPMVMSFEVAEPAVMSGLHPGDRVIGRLAKADAGLVLEKVRVTGTDPTFTAAVPAGPPPLRVGEALPAVQVVTPGGETWTVGEGQGSPTLLTFVYTTCPSPEFCPATVRRLQEVQALLPGVRLVAVTIDPEVDTLDVLGAYATGVGANPATWRFGRVEGEAAGDLFRRAALTSLPGKAERFEHGTRLMVLDASGKLLERFDDNRWPLARVSELLGVPVAGAKAP